MMDLSEGEAERAEIDEVFHKKGKCFCRLHGLWLAAESEKSN
jgi:hypothetical protein